MHLHVLFGLVSRGSQLWGVHSTQGCSLGLLPSWSCRDPSLPQASSSSSQPCTLPPGHTGQRPAQSRVRGHPGTHTLTGGSPSGGRIVSSKPFAPLNFRINSRNLSGESCRCARPGQRGHCGAARGQGPEQPGLKGPHLPSPSTPAARRHRHYHARGGVVPPEGLRVVDREASVVLPAHHRPHHSEWPRVGSLLPCAAPARDPVPRQPGTLHAAVAHFPPGPGLILFLLLSFQLENYFSSLKNPKLRVSSSAFPCCRCGWDVPSPWHATCTRSGVSA